MGGFEQWPFCDGNIDNNFTNLKIQIYFNSCADF